MAQPLPADRPAVAARLEAMLPDLTRAVARVGRRYPGIDFEDVLHDTIERALIHDDVTARLGDRALFAWCLTTAARRFQEIRRLWDDGDHHVPVADIAATYEAAGVVSADPADVVAAADVAEAVRAAVAALPPRERYVVHAAYQEQLPQREVAARVGVTVQTVNMLMYRARKRLRPQLRPLRTITLLGSGTAALRRALRPARVPAPAVAASAAAALTLTAVLQYTPPARVRPAGPNSSAGVVVATATAQRFPRDRALATPGDRSPARTLTKANNSAAESGDPTRRPTGGCKVACLVPPLHNTVPARERGDEITLLLPRDVERHTGRVSVRQSYVPICDRWVPNPAATCRRHGNPNWIVPPAQP